MTFLLVELALILFLGGVAMITAAVVPGGQ